MAWEKMTLPDNWTLRVVAEIFVLAITWRGGEEVWASSRVPNLSAVDRRSALMRYLGWAIGLNCVAAAMTMPGESVVLARLPGLLPTPAEAFGCGELRVVWAVVLALLGTGALGVTLVLLPTRDGRIRAFAPTWSGLGEDIEDSGLIETMLRFGVGLLAALAAIFVVAATFVPASAEQACHASKHAEIRAGDLSRMLSLPLFEPPVPPETQLRPEGTGAAEAPPQADGVLPRASAIGAVIVQHLVVGGQPMIPLACPTPPGPEPPPPVPPRPRNQIPAPPRARSPRCEGDSAR